jgi:hypothetical protein
MTKTISTLALGSDTLILVFEDTTNTLTINKNDSGGIWSQAADTTKTPADALQEVVAAANTFLAATFPAAVPVPTWTEQFAALVDALVLELDAAGVPYIK